MEASFLNLTLNELTNHLISNNNMEEGKAALLAKLIFAFSTIVGREES